MEYLGFKEMRMTTEDFCVFNEDYKMTLPSGMLTNEYLCVKDIYDTPLAYYKWDGERKVEIGFQEIRSKFLGSIKPRNIEQRFAIDMLFDDRTTVKVLTGKFGVGKDFLMCSSAISLIESGKFERIVWVRNNIEVKNSKPIGHLPGDSLEKLLPFAMPLADHLGGKEGLQMMISKGTVEVEHLGFMRGRDIKNSIIMCSEAENMTKEHIQLLIGRVGEGSALWLNGDFKQVDAQVFATNSGLMQTIDKLKGHPRFAYVQLLKTERSETAAMADLLD